MASSPGRDGATRRALLRGGAAGLASLVLPNLARIGFAQVAPTVAQVAPTAASMSATPVGNGCKVLTVTGSNMLAVTTAEGLVLVDSGAVADRPALQAWLVENDVDRVAAVFNTHWHPDQVGANEWLGGAGARIIAHEKTRQRLHAGYYVPAEDRYEAPLPAAGLPTETFYDDGTTDIGGRHIDYGYLIEAHTDGDIFVAFPELDVIAVGDAVASGRDPELEWYGGGWLGGRLDALERLLDMSNADTRFVPAHGPVIGRAEVESERQMLATLFDRFVERIRLGESARDMFDGGILDGLGRELADPHAFVYSCYQGFWAHHNALTHDIV